MTELAGSAPICGNTSVSNRLRIAATCLGERKNLVYEIESPDGTKILPKRQWLWSKERTEDALKKGEIEFVKGRDGWTVHSKQYLKDEKGEVRKGKAFSIIDDVYSQHGTNEIIEEFGDAQIFSFPKPTALLNKLIGIGEYALAVLLLLAVMIGEDFWYSSSENLSKQPPTLSCFEIAKKLENLKNTASELELEFKWLEPTRDTLAGSKRIVDWMNRTNAMQRKKSDLEDSARSQGCKIYH